MPCAEPTSGQVHGMSGKLPPVLRITDHTSQQQNASIYFETETPEKSPAQHLHGSTWVPSRRDRHKATGGAGGLILFALDRGLDLPDWADLKRTVAKSSCQTTEPVVALGRYSREGLSVHAWAVLLSGVRSGIKGMHACKMESQLYGVWLVSGGLGTRGSVFLTALWHLAAGSLLSRKALRGCHGIPHGEYQDVKDAAAFSCVGVCMYALQITPPCDRYKYYITTSGIRDQTRLSFAPLPSHPVLGASHRPPDALVVAVAQASSIPAIASSMIQSPTPPVARHDSRRRR
ncbi:predicted protein [Aspergillus terreus NIH2624]|uniref:Uncharacterized protein n=1 Tax=Aspergillus terreus (strain NIH 2624 / FGSC A1156) TaxID=341663 RepID=Q0D007_ASPTN|nr:uncharacterized protein ATEG_00727 [Aspergillus terreus NIH2624]EAU39373.1 predicted protein [Aspergillus terreus NIH2624]